MKKAMYYKKTDDGAVQCLLCPHNCIIKKDRVGICRNRKNIDGTLYSLNYGKVSSVGIDPIEKKPLYNFYPGSNILSLGTLGCNLSCDFCQNWSISQASCDGSVRDVEDLSCKEAVDAALKYKDSGNIGIAYTYNEPFIWYEYVYETSQLVKKKGLNNVLVTNGFVNEEPLKEILPFIDAANIDLKAMNDDFYKKLCHGRLEPVLNTCRIMNDSCLIELTNLIITGRNDSKEDIMKLVDWVYDNLGKDTPLHFSRYRPEYKMKEPPTSMEALDFAYEYASKKLSYVYVGNIYKEEWSDTFCPKCKSIVIKRGYMGTDEINIKNGNECTKCLYKLNIIS
ncbi:MAG: AmmeMemoRadiSam system radical SAM enzyme [Armatimonadota bacterium]